MNKKWYAIIITVILIFLALIIVINKSKNNKIDTNENFKIVTSFYPIYIMTSNITQGAENIELVNMTEVNVGCLHDYTLSTSDMKKIENADVFIENGLELENFMDKVISAYTELKIIDSSNNIKNKIVDENEVNPHIWTSIENVKKQVENIYSKLCQYNLENIDIYTKNYEKYIQDLNNLKERYEIELSNLKDVKVICLNEALTYLLNEQNMDVTTIETDHEESTLSADSLKDLIIKMKEEDIQIIVIDKNDNSRNAQTLANETGAKIISLNSGLSGEDSKEAYMNAMLENLEQLKQI